MTQGVSPVTTTTLRETRFHFSCKQYPFNSSIEHCIPLVSNATKSVFFIQGSLLYKSSTERKYQKGKLDKHFAILQLIPWLQILLDKLRIRSGFSCYNINVGVIVFAFICTENVNRLIAWIRGKLQRIIQYTTNILFTVSS